MKQSSILYALLLGLSVICYGRLQAQTLQVTLSPDKSKVDRSTKNGIATVFFDSSIEDLSIVCTAEDPNEPIIKINDNLWYTHIDVNKDLEEEGVCYRNYLLKSSASAEYYLTTDTIAPNQVLYYTVTLPNELEPKYLEEKARNIAKKASALVDEGDSYLARLLAVQALPPNLPYTLEAEMALRKAMMGNSTELRGHSGRIGSMSFSPDNQRLISSSEDGTAKIWDVKTGRVITTLTGHSKNVSSASFSPDGEVVVTTSPDSTIRIWNSHSAKLLETIHIPARCISAAFSPDGKQIVSTATDLTIRTWDSATGEIIPIYKSKDFIPWNIQYSPDGTKILFNTMSDKNPLVALDSKTGKELYRLGGEKGGSDNIILSFNCSQDGSKIVYASLDSTVRVWDAITGENLFVLKNKHPQMMIFSAFMMDGKAILGVSLDKGITIWNSENGKELMSTDGELATQRTPKIFAGAALSPDNNFLALCSPDNDGWLQDLLVVPDGKTYKLDDLIYDVTFSPSGDTVAVAMGDKGVRVLDAKSGKTLYTIDKEKDDVRSVSFSPDGQFLVFASYFKQTIRIWDTSRKRLKKTLSGSPDWVYSARFSPDGRHVVSASGSFVYVWDVNTGEIVSVLKGHKNTVIKSCYSPNGKIIASVSLDNTVRLWDVETYTSLMVLIGHSSSVRDVAFSPEGNYAASASEDGTIILWDVLTGNNVKTFRGHLIGVNSLSFSPDGKCLISTGTDKNVIVWDVQTGQKSFSWNSYSSPYSSLSFSANGRKILAYRKKSIYIWDFPPLQELIDETVERFKDRPLTEEEKVKYNLE